MLAKVKCFVAIPINSEIWMASQNTSLFLHPSIKGYRLTVCTLFKCWIQDPDMDVSSEDGVRRMKKSQSLINQVEVKYISSFPTSNSYVPATGFCCCCYCCWQGPWYLVHSQPSVPQPPLEEIARCSIPTCRIYSPYPSSLNLYMLKV